MRAFGVMNIKTGAEKNLPRLFPAEESVGAGSCRFRQSHVNLLFHRIERQFFVGWERRAVLLQALQISFDRFHGALVGFLVGVAFGYEALAELGRSRRNRLPPPAQTVPYSDVET